MYTLAFKRSVKKDFQRIHKADIAFIKESLYAFAERYDAAYEQRLMQQGTVKKLQGEKETLYRLRLRRYRVIYKKEEDKLVILVLSVKQREGAYKK